MLTRSRITLATLASMLAAGNAFAVSKEAQEFMNIQSKMAPDQCELQRLSSQAVAAQRACYDVTKRRGFLTRPRLEWYLARRGRALAASR